MTVGTKDSVTTMLNLSLSDGTLQSQSTNFMLMYKNMFREEAIIHAYEFSVAVNGEFHFLVSSMKLSVSVNRLSTFVIWGCMAFTNYYVVVFFDRLQRLHVMRYRLFDHL